MLNRKEFLKISGGTAASLLIGSKNAPVFAGEDFFKRKDDHSHGSLLLLEANPPQETTAVRFFIDDMRVSEITDLYAVKMKTKPVWKTMIDPSWLPPGDHQLRIEADTTSGNKTIETKKLIIQEQENSSQKINLTGAWQFAEMSELPAHALDGEIPEAVHLGYQQGSWSTIFVPNSLGAVKKEWNQYEGIQGIYKRNFHIDSFAKQEQVFLVMESCYWSGIVFVNAKKAGETHGGYLPSRFDITPFLNSGSNEIAIIVDNRFTTMGVFKRLNEFYWNWGGLVQEVFIEKHPSVSCTALRAQGKMNGDLELHVTGFNNTGSVKSLPVEIEVYNHLDKKIAGAIRTIATLPPGENIVQLKTIKITHPDLWHPDTPYLYTVKLKLNAVVLKERTGFRDVKVNGADVLINGKIIQHLQGFDRHADYPGLGRTQPDALAYEELKMLRDKGFRFFRPAHYPTTPGQLKAADELGLLVIEEINVTGLKGDVLATKEVKDFGAKQLTGMIHRDRSHPCIIAWSVGNENFTEQEGAEEYVRETIAIGRSLDPTRLFTQVTHRHTTDRTFKYQDIVAQNYYAGWYAKDVNVIPNLLDSVQAYAGDKPIVLSEYGAETIIGKPGTEKSTEFYQGLVVDAHNRLLENRKHFFGKMYWCSTDFWCRPNWTGGSPDPLPPFHLKSLISYDRAYKKLGWKVMFSPVRLLFNPHTVKMNEIGGDVEVQPAQDATVIQVITIKEIRNQHVKGKILLELPPGFSAIQNEFDFQLAPEELKTITINIKGKLLADQKQADCFIRAVIDDDTEAQPLFLSIKPAAQKP